MFNKDIFKREIKRNRKGLFIWLISLSVLIVLMMLVFPAISNIDIAEILEGMGMDVVFGLGFNYSVGYFGTELGIMIQMGGAIFASLLGINLMFREEKEKTAEFLLSKPLSRKEVWWSKLCSLIALITIFNVVILLVSLLMVSVFSSVGVACTAADFAAFFVYMLLTYIFILTIGLICFSISAVLNRRSGTGIAMGIAIGSYFISLLVNIVYSSINIKIVKEFFKYVRILSPYDFCEGTKIIGFIGHEKITAASEFNIAVAGVVFWVVAVTALLILSYKKYNKKDLLI